MVYPGNVPVRIVAAKSINVTYSISLGICSWEFIILDIGGYMKEQLSFFNTIASEGKELVKFEQQAHTQEEKVLEYFRKVKKEPPCKRQMR